MFLLWTDWHKQTSWTWWLLLFWAAAPIKMKKGPWLKHEKHLSPNKSGIRSSCGDPTHWCITYLRFRILIILTHHTFFLGGWNCSMTVILLILVGKACGEQYCEVCRKQPCKFHMFNKGPLFLFFSILFPWGEGPLQLVSFYQLTVVADPIIWWV